MTRAKLREVVIDRLGNALQGVSVELRQPNSATPTTDTIYADATGGATLANPLTTDVNGAVEGYLPTHQAVSADPGVSNLDFAWEAKAG